MLLLNFLNAKLEVLYLAILPNHSFLRELLKTATMEGKTKDHRYCEIFFFLLYFLIDSNDKRTFEANEATF